MAKKHYVIALEEHYQDPEVKQLGPGPGAGREVVERLHLPFELLSDSRLELARALQLPTFSVAGQTLIKRLTLVGRGGRIEKCLYPVFPPNADAGNVLKYIYRDAA